MGLAITSASRGHRAESYVKMDKEIRTEDAAVEALPPVDEAGIKGLAYGRAFSHRRGSGRTRFDAIMHDVRR